MNLLDYLPQRYRATEDPLRTQRRIELGVVVLVMGLCLQLVFGGVQLLVMSSPTPVMPAADSILVPSVNSPESVTAQQRNEILARPVFWAGRRPVTEVALMKDGLADKAAASQLKGITLVGVFGGGDSSGIIALVKDKKRRILLGEELDGWILESVEGGEAVLVSGVRRETLTLQRGSIAASDAIAVDKPRQPPAAAGKQAKQKIAAPAAVPAVNAGESSAPASGGLTLGGSAQ